MLEDLKLGPLYDGFLFLAEAARNPPLLRAHHHVELELNLVVRGEITYVVGGQRFTFGKRCLLWMFPSQEHQLVHRTPDAQNYVAVFKPEMIAWSCRGAAYEGLKRDSPGVEGVLHTVLEPDDYDLVRKNMGTMMEGTQDPDLLNLEAGFGLSLDFRYEHADPDGLNAGLHHLLLLCWRLQRAARGEGPHHPVPLHPAVRRAIHLLSEQPGEGEDLDLLAARCGVSTAYLSRVFARQVGVPLSQYRNSLRLGRFWSHYRAPVQRTITECVYAAGFGSYAQFYKVFAQAYGRGPRECLAENAA
jgi:AraC-like DNA-binding protein